MASAAAPWSSNHPIASIAVLPPPTITNPAGVRDPGELTDRDAATLRRHRERWRLDPGTRVAKCVASTTRRRTDTSCASAHRRREPSIAEVLAHREEADPPGAEQAGAHELVVVGADLRARRPFEEPGFRTAVRDAVPTERRRVHAVVARGLVQLHERIRAEPVTTRTVPPIDHDHIGIAAVEEGIDERHAERPGTDHEVVGLEPVVPGHTETVTLRPDRVERFGIPGVAAATLWTP